MPSMKEFIDWLNTSRGAAKRLSDQLGIAPTNITQWKKGTIPIPWAHMERIAKLSKGKVPLKMLYKNRLNRSERKTD